MQLKISIDGQREVASYFAAKPKQIKRATLFTTKQITRELHKELGSSIPKEVSTSIAGYKKARARRTVPKARRRTVRGVVWMGTNRIPAIFAGKARQGKGYVKVRRHKFENAFIMKFKSGHESIMIRKSDGGLKEAMIDLPNSSAQARSAASNAQGRIKRIMRERLRKELAKGTR